ncbi:hypothetical protein CDG76_03170 [Nostoc sp. 'Peltigera membranacea cyanobiont' 210A]|uniref:SUKH-3 domain-containing protein n=1 Tax=Nostoc sp. 'Peltigera membranacea cyanobiont' 210A TaxID=2014529 RepID=UPI000B953A06|nr:SUKH-3 domain-containing protein [Nostoc sp. 'Peltigera membranacea cyanobiont' 210A]OYD97854.1 hypothetical protein CDG76_03170 [Nostoc sp. 'Peltigera membranacea cyanobiont' 210A]
MDFNSQETKILLEKAGWSKNHLVDTSEYEHHLKKIGYSVFPSVTHFLRQFGGLQISQNASDAATERYRLKVDPIELTQYHSRQMITEFEEALGRSLCPVALALNGSAAIVMDEEGRIYCIDELVLFHVADTVPNAIRIISSTDLSEFNKILELD